MAGVELTGQSITINDLYNKARSSPIEIVIIE